MEKQLIAERFARARKTYDREARVQYKAAERMLRLLQPHIKRTGLDILEVGCGTGIYSRLLRQEFQPSELWLNVSISFRATPKHCACLLESMSLLLVPHYSGSANRSSSSDNARTSCLQTAFWHSAPSAPRTYKKSGPSPGMGCTILLHTNGVPCCLPVCVCGIFPKKQPRCTFPHLRMCSAT